MPAADRRVPAKRARGHSHVAVRDFPQSAWARTPQRVRGAVIPETLVGWSAKRARSTSRDVNPWGVMGRQRDVDLVVHVGPLGWWLRFSAVIATSVMNPNPA